MKLKRYIVCAWYDYYPAGGLGNIEFCSDDLEEAKRKADELSERYNNAVVHDRDSENVHDTIYDATG